MRKTEKTYAYNFRVIIFYLFSFSFKLMSYLGEKKFS